MKNFEFINAKTLDEALKALSELGNKALVVAGGTNVMIDIRAGKLNDKTLVNIRDIDALRGISMENNVITIGALTTLYDIEQSDLLKENAPALWMAAQTFADPTTRHIATIGGNNANASPDADTSTSLLVLDAKVNVKSLKGDRQIPINEYFKGVRKTALAPDELIVSFSFAPAKCAYLKIGQRNSMAISVITVASAAELNDDGTVKWVRTAIGSCSPTAVRAFNAEKAVVGKKLTEEVWADVAKEIQKDINPRAGSLRATPEYKREVAPVLMKRTILKALYGECELRKECAK